MIAGILVIMIKKMKKTNIAIVNVMSANAAMNHAINAIVNAKKIAIAIKLMVNVVNKRASHE